MCPQRLTTLAALGTTLAALGGCRDSKSPAQRAEAGAYGAAAHCNVLLITMDTTRADHIGCYGFARAATPVLDGLAQRGVRFSQALSQAPITLVSHTVLLTGTYPPENGVRDNDRYALGTELPTLPEVFRSHGYQTGAFVGCSVLDKRYGLGRGFDVYSDNMPTGPNGRPLYVRKGEVVADDALAWLQKVADKPFFAWVHFFDPHAPYAPPPEFLQNAPSAYDGEIAFMDSQIGRLVTWLQTQNLLSRTLVVAVADHGESLGEHGYLWHALFVYDSLLHVPLIFSLPDRLPQNATADSLVRIVDIMPTVLDLMGWETPPQVSGESFTPALLGQTLPERQSYGESCYPYDSFGWSKLVCLTDRRWKYIRAPKAELYDRQNDRGELKNLLEADPDAAARLAQDLRDWEARMRKYQPGEVKRDARAAEALRSLGYVAGPGPTAGSEENLKDPKDMVDIEQSFRWAESLLARQRPAEVIEHMEPAAQRSPESFLIVELLGKAYAAEELFDFAELAFGQALALQPRSPETWGLLAQVLGVRRAYGRAIKACEQALQIDPEALDAQRLLPQLRELLAQQTAQIDKLRAELRAQPDSAELAFALGDELAVAGATAEAVTVLRTGLEHNPQNIQLANNLAWIMATSPDDHLRNGAEALRLAQVACAGESATNPTILDTLAAAQAETRDFDAAVATLQRAADLARQAGNTHLAAELAQRTKYYQEKRPFRAPA